MAVRQRVLLTGATGHVGGRLFSHLLAHESVDLRAVVRSPHRLAHFAKNAEILGGDLVDELTRRNALHGVAVSRVFSISRQFTSMVRL